MINDQEYITTNLKKTLEKVIILSTPHLNNFFLRLLADFLFHTIPHII